MIPKKAIEAFVSRKRYSYEFMKELTDDQLEERMRALPGRPPIWSKLRREQKVCFLLGAKYRRWAMHCDCVAPDTLIETDCGPRRIDDLARLGKPIFVQALTPTGVRLVPATSPFLKGYASLYQVRLSSGRTVKVTAHHRFLTERGWTTCENLLIGERLPKFSHDPLATILAPYPSTFQPDARRSKSTVSSYLDRSCTPSDDERPHVEEDIYPNDFPSPNDVQAHNQPWLHKDDRGSVCTNNFRLEPDHHSMTHSWNQDFLYSNCKECQPHEYDAAPSSYAHENTLLNETGDIPDLQVQQDYPNRLTHVSFLTHFETVTNVTYLYNGAYYDLHVPIHQNYIAHGICNHNTGVGKTIISIALIRYFASIGEANRVLVMVPNKINKTEWADEIEKHSPGTPYCLLDGSSAHKWEQLENTNALIVVDTYAGLFRMVCDLVAVKKRGKKPQNRLKPSAKRVRTLCRMIDGLVLDESTAVANKGTLPFRIARQLIRTACMAIELTGTPFGRDPTALWSQMLLIDDGWSLGENLALFRSVFFTAKKNFWGGYEYTFRPSRTKLLHRFIAHRSIRYEADESTLPRLVSIIKEVSLPGDAQAYYDKAKAAIIAAHGNFSEMKNNFIRMRQISSGFVGYHDDEVGSRAQFEFRDNPKLDLLLSLLEEIGPDKKVLVFHDFIFSGAIIARELRAAGVKHVRLEARDKDPGAVLHKFKTDPDCSVFVLGTAGAYGLNLQVAEYGIFYETPLSQIVRKQMIRRFERQGSEHKTIFLYDLLVKGTVDRLILHYHEEGSELFRAIIEGKDKL